MGTRRRCVTSSQAEVSIVITALVTILDIWSWGVAHALADKVVKMVVLNMAIYSSVPFSSS